MPRRGHSSGRRAGTGQSDSESSSESRSDLEGASLGTRHVPRIVQAPPVVRMAVNTQVACPGCGLAFASLYILKQHRNAHWLANPACQAAASAMKRPRIVRLPAGGPGAASGAQALIDRMMMGDGDRGIAPEAVAADPSRYPRHGDGVSEQNNVCMRCVKCVQEVCK